MDNKKIVIHFLSHEALTNQPINYSPGHSARRHFTGFEIPALIA